MHADHSGVFRHPDDDLKTFDNLLLEFPCSRFEFLRNRETHDPDHPGPEFPHPGQGGPELRIGLLRRFGDRIGPVRNRASVAVDGNARFGKFLLKELKFRVRDGAQILPEQGTGFDVAPAEFLRRLNLAVKRGGRLVGKTGEIH